MQFLFFSLPMILLSSSGSHGIASAPTWENPNSSSACFNNFTKSGWSKYPNSIKNLSGFHPWVAITTKWPCFTPFEREKEVCIFLITGTSTPSPPIHSPQEQVVHVLPMLRGTNSNNQNKLFGSSYMQSWNIYI